MAVLLVISSLLPGIKVHAVSLSPTLILSEVKVRHDSSSVTDYDEFIELTNLSSSTIKLSDFVLEYFNVTNPPETQLPIQKPVGNGLLEPGKSFVLTKQPALIAHSADSPFSSLADSGGRLRLVSSEGDVVDEVAWTNNQTLVKSEYPYVIYQCNTSTTSCNANKLQSLSRDYNQENKPVGWKLGAANPASAELPPETPPTESPATGTAEPPKTDEPTTTCEGIIISEILPNPEGSDTGHEFIELYNPTSAAISLNDCSLQTSASSKKYDFSNIDLHSGEYKAWYDSVTGLSLPNSSGGKVWLLSPTDELQTINYPPELDDDTSWALIDNLWEITYAPTPGSLNIAMPLKPCATGQVRKAETNRCETLATLAVANLSSCKVGQERNPETNRCKSTSSLVSSALVPCKVGQERNPRD